MKVIRTDIPDLLVLEPRVFGDERGFFFESFNQQQFDEAVGRNVKFVQDNHSRSVRGVLRGLHYQMEQTQGKLVRVVAGTVYDVAVDIRRSSPTFGKSIGVILSAENKAMFWVPEGFAHGFLVLSESADFLYKTTDFYLPRAERAILWNDPDLAIPWPLELLHSAPVQLSGKDKEGSPFNGAEVFA